MLNEQFMLLFATTRQHPQPLFWPALSLSLFQFIHRVAALFPPFFPFSKSSSYTSRVAGERCGISTWAHGVSEGDDAALIAFGGGMGGVLCTRVACCQGADPSFFLSSSRMLMLPCSFCNFEAWRRLMDSAPSHQLGWVTVSAHAQLFVQIPSPSGGNLCSFKALFWC